MKVCYWGTYDKEYPRNKTIILGLRKNGVEVIECHEPIWKSTQEKIAKASSGWLDIKLIGRWIIVYLKLIFRFFKEKERFDFIFIGYSGHFDIFLAKILSKIKKIPLVFDAFLSIYEAFVVDRPAIKPNSVKAKILYWVDKYSCKLADIVLLDTNEHINYFCHTFNLSQARFRRSFIGASEALFYPREPTKKKDSFLVIHFGRYIPLHGLTYIVKAAKELESYKDIYFQFIGSGEEYESTVKLAKELGLKRVEFIEFVKPQELVNYISKADICLGIFGHTDKAKRVIPNKVYEALAMAKPVITGNSPAANELLTDKENCLLGEMANPQAIANSILYLKNDENLKTKIAKNGYELFKNKASAEVLGREIKEILDKYYYHNI